MDFEIGRILRQVLERKLDRELGFESFERYVEERLDLAPRTARRLVRLARVEHRAPALASAFRAGRITLPQAEVLPRGERREALGMALRTTLCAHHHQRGVHAGRLSIRGRAPDELVYTLGVGRFRSGDVVEG